MKFQTALEAIFHQGFAQFPSKIRNIAFKITIFCSSERMGDHFATPRYRITSHDAEPAVISLTHPKIDRWRLMFAFD